jgi:hypothetical protein
MAVPLTVVASASAAPVAIPMRVEKRSGIRKVLDNNPEAAILEPV